jgi:hypothetical protein
MKKEIVSDKKIKKAEEEIKNDKEKTEEYFEKI